MALKTLSEEDLIREGTAALAERLGPLDAVRFLQLVAPGQGDYTAERQEILSQLTREEWIEALERRRLAAEEEQGSERAAAA